jgi:hypothetical protein
LPLLRLVKPANEQQSRGVQFTTRGHRAYFAYQCLPRRPDGSPPAQRELERAHGLYHQSLNKLFYDKVANQGYDVIKRFALALSCSAEWLQDGTGAAPTASHQVFPRPPPDEKKRRKRAVRPTRKAVGFR